MKPTQADIDFYFRIPRPTHCKNGHLLKGKKVRFFMKKQSGHFRAYRQCRMCEAVYYEKTKKPKYKCAVAVDQDHQQHLEGRGQAE